MWGVETGWGRGDYSILGSNWERECYFICLKRKFSDGGKLRFASKKGAVGEFGN